MYCMQCGNELGDNGVCAACGAGATMQQFADGVGKGGSQHVSWEYARTTVERDLAQVATDCYESLGFELTGTRSEGPHAKSTLSFRRSRKVKGKAQLAKIQRVMDDLLSRISSLEGEKTRKATIRALAVGIVSALVLGVGMCCTMVWDGLMVPGIIIGLIGIAGCVGGYLIYRNTCASEAARLNPQIEATYDELATVCEEAQTLLHA